MRRSVSSKSPPPDFIAEPDKYVQVFYRRKNRQLVFGLLLSIVTLGIWPLLCYFKRSLWINFAYTKCDPSVCSVVSFVEQRSKKVLLFYVQYFSPDGLCLQPSRFLQDSLQASDYVCPRVDVGGGWWMYYDDVTKKFQRHDGPTSSLRQPSSLNASKLAFTRFTDIENKDIAVQLESGINWLNSGKDDENELVGYQKVPLFTFLLYFEFVISAGIFWLFCYWQPLLQLYLTHRRCNLLAADTLLVMTPPNKTKKQPNAADIFPPWLQTLFYYGVMHAVLIFLPLGLFVMLGFLIALQIVLRPYAVRKVMHSTRDGQIVRVPVSKARLIGYFKGTACSESAVMKYFTWQKVKYVWSGAAVYGPSDNQVVIAAYCFERQIGLVAADDADSRSPLARAYAVHQVMGIAPTISYLRSCKGHSQSEVNLISGLLGKNTMDLPLTPLIVVFFREILSPFYIFQIFSVSVWLADGYVVYAYVIIVLSAISMIWQIVSIRMGEVALRRTMHKSSVVEVRRRDAQGSLFLEPHCLVPGDVIVIPPGGCVLQCDAAILSGTCLVDEAMLTGESVPVLKFALPPVKSDGSDDELLLIRKNERSLLFCGTRVLQANSQGSSDGLIRAVVVRTGFMTAKGELTRLILYPKPLDFEFAVDAVKFIGVMAGIAVIGLCYSIGLRISRHEETHVIILRSLDIITIAVPPALPIALTIGYMMAQRRLLKRNVFCTSPSAINVAGVVDVVCMDKTGTMTEGGLDFEKLLPAKEGHFVSQTAPTSLPDGHLLRCLVSCHSLALVDGKAIGDPIEEKMFEMAGWHLTQTEGKTFTTGSTQESFCPIMIVHPPEFLNNGAPAIGIVRQLPFSSHFQRMSVVACPIQAGSRNDGMALYLKGAPEVVVSICRVTTVPPDLDIHLGALTESGYRVLGLATKALGRYSVSEILSADRDELERDLDFLGFLVFENKLKPETCGVIDQLKKAKLRIVMLTGDNALTAVSVARQAGVIDEQDQVLIVNALAPTPETFGQPVLDFIEVKRKFQSSTSSDSLSSVPSPRMVSTAAAVNGERPPSYILDMLPVSPARAVKLVVTGSSWAVVKEHFPEEIDRILMRGAVFARVNPNQKKDVIEGLQHLGFYALMCGDGANDCGALRAACTGVSLSQAEASVASPFTSKVENISCIHLLIREGRCALVTSFSIFRFMLLYAFIQFISTFILYYGRANLSQYGFLYADLFLATTLVFTMSFTEAYDYLVAEKPPSSLLELQPLLSILLQGFLIICFQVLSYLYIVYGHHVWFLPFVPPVNDTETYYCFEYFAVFMVSVFQYPCIAIVLSKGVPFRKPVFTNWLFCINLAINFAANLFICFDGLVPFPRYPKNLVNSEYKSFADLLTLAMPPSVEYRGIVFLFSCIFCFASLLTEIIFVERPWLSDKLRKLFHSIYNKKQTRRKYEYLEEQLGSSVDPWPPISRSAQGGAVTLLAQEQSVTGHVEHHKSNDSRPVVNVDRPLPKLPPSSVHHDMPLASNSNNTFAAVADAIHEIVI